MHKVVSNTTPLIALAEIGEIEILKKLYGEVLIPRAVKNEIESEPAKTIVEKANWIKAVDIRKPERKNLFSARLHAGEIEAIILAQEVESGLIIMDDNTAKKTAKFLGLNVTGSLGILVRAKESGLIQRVEPYINRLIDKGLYVDDKTKAIVLKIAGEPW